MYKQAELSRFNDSTINSDMIAVFLRVSMVQIQSLENPGNPDGKEHHIVPLESLS